MQPSARQQELERLYNSRKGHAPHISISDDNYHVTEALGSYYDDEDAPQADRRDTRPLSFVPSSAESIENSNRRSRRNGSYFDTKRTSPPRTPLSVAQSNEIATSPTEGGSGGASPKSVQRMGSMISENGNLREPGQPSPPPLSRQSSSETAIQQFPLNDIDYESSPAAVAQELSNLQAIRRMSMNVDTADPDLPSFGGSGMVSAVSPNGSEEELEDSKLFWVPARLHPELAPKEFKTFIEDRVGKIRRRSGDSESLSPDGLERSGSESSLRRKKSMLSHQIDTKGNYEDGAERLERKRSKGMSVEGGTMVELSELEDLVSDPAQLMRRMSLDTTRKSEDSGIDVPASEDMPILPQSGQTLKRSTRTTYRRGSLKKGERVPFSKRAQHRNVESDVDEPANQRDSQSVPEEPVPRIARVQTEPSPPARSPKAYEFPPRQSSMSRQQAAAEPSHLESESTQAPAHDERQERSERGSPSPSLDEDRPVQRPAQRQFHSRLASGPGRTTAQLPGYNNTNPLPHIIETLPDGTKIPAGSLISQIAERKSSQELNRPHARGGAHNRPVPGREHQRSSTLDDISSHPSPIPGTASTRTDSLTLVPTFDEKKSEKKDSSKKSGWKRVFGSDDDGKSGSDSASIKSSKSGRLSKHSGDKTRLDVLQNSIEGNAAPRGRESLVLNREDVRIEDDRKSSGKRASDSKGHKEKDTSLLSAIFGGRKRASDIEAKEKKRASKAERNLSPDAAPRILKPDIDYNWTRFSILEERAIYRMAHIKLANPRRALQSQVLLSNFMYSYLAKVQMMHPQVQIPAAHQRNHRGSKKEEQQQQPAEYSQYQRWQQQQEREEAGRNDSSTTTASANSNIENGNVAYDQTQHSRSSFDFGTNSRSSREYEDENSGAYDQGNVEEYDHEQQQSSYHAQSASSGGGGAGGAYGRTNGARAGNTSTRGNYKVAGSHDYLGYRKDQQPFDRQGLWDDDEKTEELW